MGGRGLRWVLSCTASFLEPIDARALSGRSCLSITPCAFILLFLLGFLACLFTLELILFTHVSRPGAGCCHPPAVTAIRCLSRGNTGGVAGGERHETAAKLWLHIHPHPLDPRCIVLCGVMQVRHVVRRRPDRRRLFSDPRLLHGGMRAAGAPRGGHRVEGTNVAAAGQLW